MNKATLLPAIVMLASASHPAFAQTTFERTVQVSGAVELDVVSNAGGIVLTVGGSSEVKVRGVLKPILGMVDFGRSEENIRSLTQTPPIEQIGNRIRVGYSGNAELLNDVSMRLEIEVPRDTRVRARTTSGGIRLADVSGPVDGQTTSGHIEVRDIGGETRLKANSGGITIDSVAGPVIAETTSGRIELHDIAGTIRTSTNSGSIIIQRAEGTIIARNRSGSIEATEVGAALDATTGSGAVRLSQTKAAPIRARTGSGQIRVKLATDAGYELLARSNTGKISSPGNSVGSHYVKGSIAGGGPLVELATTSSRIVVE